MAKESLKKISTFSKNMSPNIKEIEVLNDLMHESYFKLKPSKRKIADSLTKGSGNIGKEIIDSYTFSINPYFQKQRHPNINHFICTIDTRRSDVYTETKKYLYENKKRYSSFCTTGDADFVVLFSVDSQNYDEFMEKILFILKEAPKKEDEKLINCYEIKMPPRILNGKIINGHKDFDEDLLKDRSLLSKIEQARKNYIDGSFISKLGGKPEVESFLGYIQEKNILVSPYIIRDFITYKVRAFILVLYSQLGFIDKIIKKIEKKNIIYLFELNPIHTEEYYRNVDFVLVAEFENINEYHKWKENLYDLFQEVEQNINVFTFTVESIVSELPFGLDLGFENLYEKYSCESIKEAIKLGYPIYLGEEWKNKNICLDLGAITQHGMILGEKGTGKTTTDLLIASRFYDKNKRVHMVDMTDGIDESKMKEVLPDYLKKGAIEFVDIEKFLIDPGITLKAEKGKIFIYNVKRDDIQEKVIKTLLDSVKNLKGEERNIKHIFFFEEAHTFLENKALVNDLVKVLEYAGRKGVSLWISTQKLSHFPERKNKPIYDEFQNRIIHKLKESEAEAVADLLKKSIKPSEILYDMQSEITNLSIGEAFVSLKRKENGEISNNLPPIKIKIDKLDFV